MPPSEKRPRGSTGRPVDRRLVVVANRLPFTVHRTQNGLEERPSAGGLVSALEPVLRQRGGTWVGWPGLALRKNEVLPEGDRPHRVRAVPLSEGEVNRYYLGFSNRTLWPLFHSMPGNARFERRHFETYQSVNRRFAEAVVEEAEERDLIWVHDYQLLLAPGSIRRRMPEARLAFFLHIPFPPWEIFRLLPWDREILRGLLACDLIGFHTGGYARNFFDCCERTLGARVDRERMLVQDGEHLSRVGAFRLGIEFEEFEQRAMDAPSQPEIQTERVVLGVDRLDYTKGIPDRIRAFERLLEIHPEHREKVVLIQLAVPSRSQVAEYRALKREIDELVGRVNGRFASATWSPIRYLYRSVSQDRLAGLYRDAHVALVTPLRDGMNLVAKEYVASQVADPGVLVLSSLAGAADTMREALIVNPYNVDETAEAIHRALTMGSTERRSRMSGLRARERRDDVQSWVRGFLAAAEEAVAVEPSLSPLSDANFEEWLEDYLNRPRLVLFLDYDGTLTPLVDHPSKATLSASMRAVLESCAKRGDTDVAIISGRSVADVAKMVGDPNLTYAGNHGLQIRGPEIDEFEHDDLLHYSERTEELAEELEALAEDGAWVEPKGPTLTFHFRNAPEERRGELARAAREIITGAGYQARDAHAALEARPPIGWDKGRAVLHILRARYGPAWSEDVRVLYLGDDETDEDAFRFLAGLAKTFRVGPAPRSTAAAHRLPDVDTVERLLGWIARHPPFEHRRPES